MRSKRCLKFVLFLLIQNVYCQNTEISSSLDGKKYVFNKIDFTQVDEYTGKAAVSIPIVNLKLDEIEVPISIDYLIGGIKVNDVASNVGLGWSLNAGGKVYKEVNGIEDNQVYYFNYQGPGMMPKGLLVDATNYFKDLPDFYSVNMSLLKTKFLINTDFMIKELEHFGEASISFVRGITDNNIAFKYGYKSCISLFGFPYPDGCKNAYLLCANGFFQAQPYGPQYNPNVQWMNFHYTDTQQIIIKKNGYEFNFADWEHSFGLSKDKDIGNYALN